MHYLRILALALAATLLVACAHTGNQHPRLGYKDKDHPQSDTAIVSCADNNFHCGIVAVDTVNTWNIYNGGKTMWVRVLPGKRVIKLTLANARYISRPAVTIDDVQPGHVYRIVITDNVTSLSATYKDLGKADTYSLTMPRTPFPPKVATAHF